MKLRHVSLNYYLVTRKTHCVHHHHHYNDRSVINFFWVMKYFPIYNYRYIRSFQYNPNKVHFSHFLAMASLQISLRLLITTCLWIWSLPSSFSSRPTSCLFQNSLSHTFNAFCLYTRTTKKINLSYFGDSYTVVVCLVMCH